MSTLIRSKGYGIRKARSLASQLLVCGIFFLAACGSESARPEIPTDIDQIYWDLELNHHMVRLAMTQPYDTLTLSALALNGNNDVLNGLPSPQYSSTDGTKVVVTPDGILQAIAPTSQHVAVIATLGTDDVVHADTVYVTVVSTASPPVLGSVVLDPVPPDTAKRSSNPVGSVSYLQPFAVTAIARDTAGSVIAGLPVYYRSSDPSVATIDRFSGQIQGVRPGVVTFTAQTTAFGVQKIDTLPYEIGLPIVTEVAIQRIVSSDGSVARTFFPSEIRVGTGALVIWRDPNSTTDGAPLLEETDLTFDDAQVPVVTAGSSFGLSIVLVGFEFPVAFFCSFVLQSDCTSGGNQVMGAPGWGTALTFPVPGVYEYRSTIHGSSGRVIVVDES